MSALTTRCQMTKCPNAYGTPFAFALKATGSIALSDVYASLLLEPENVDEQDEIQ